MDRALRDTGAWLLPINILGADHKHITTKPEHSTLDQSAIE